MCVKYVYIYLINKGVEDGIDPRARNKNGHPDPAKIGGDSSIYFHLSLVV